jgi:hypothetical protein
MAIVGAWFDASCEAVSLPMGRVGYLSFARHVNEVIVDGA